MDHWPAVMHAVRIAHGIGASVIAAAALHFAGMALLQRAGGRFTAGIAPALVGAALYVVLCWYAIGRGISVTQSVLIYGGAVALLAAAGHRRIRAQISDPVFRRNVRQSFFNFALLYVVAYLFTLPPATPDRLPVAWTGNVDLMTYARYTRYFLHLGASNLADFSYLNFVYLQTPGLFYLLGAFSLLFGQDPLSAQMPIQFALIAFSGTLVAAISRAVFNLSQRAALTVACIFISGPFFRYVAANYFLSTLMAMPILLYLLWTTIQERATRIVDISMAARFGAPYILLLFIYPFLLFVGIGLQAAAIVLRLLAELQTRGDTLAARAALRHAFGTGFTVVAALAVVGGLFRGRLVWSVDMIVSLSEKGIAGWPLAFISPQALFAWPGIRSGAMQVPAASQALAVTVFAGIAALMVAAYFWWFRSRTTAPQSAFAGLLALAILLYCAYFSMVGPSYQQWKFASYAVLPLSFVLMAAVAQGLCSPTLFARVASSAADRRLLTVFPSFLALSLILGNIAAHAAFDPPLRRLPGALHAIADIDKVPSFREITVRMSDAPDSLPTWVALYYLPNKKVHVVSKRFRPSSPLSLELVSRHRPLLMQDFGCQGVGHNDTASVPGVGCLLFAPPSLQAGVIYPFNRTYLFMSYEGMTARQPDGRWNSRPSVPFKVSIDPQKTPLDGIAYLNFFVRPQDVAHPQQVVFRWGAGLRGETSVAGQEWLSLGVRSSDWTGNRLWTLDVSVDLAAPGALLFHELVLTAMPKGRLIAEPVRSRHQAGSAGSLPPASAR